MTNRQLRTLQDDIVVSVEQGSSLSKLNVKLTLRDECYMKQFGVYLTPAQALRVAAELAKEASRVLGLEAY